MLSKLMRHRYRSWGPKVTTRWWKIRGSKPREKRGDLDRFIAGTLAKLRLDAEIVEEQVRELVLELER